MVRLVGKSIGFFGARVFLHILFSIFLFRVSFSDRFHGAKRIYFEYEMNDLKMITSNKLIIVYMVNIRDKYWIKEKYTMIMMD